MGGLISTGLEKVPSRWQNENEPRLGQAVLIQDNTKKRLYWNLGVITALRPGRDGKVRAVELKLPTGNTVKRDIRTLVPLEVGDDENTTFTAAATPRRMLEFTAPSSKNATQVAEARTSSPAANSFPEAKLTTTNEQIRGRITRRFPGGAC